MLFLCSTAFRKHMIVSSVAILAIFSTYPSAAEPILILLNRPLQPASHYDTYITISCSSDVSLNCRRLAGTCWGAANNIVANASRRGRIEMCRIHYNQCMQRGGCR
jgi:hypothetical protein